MTLLASDINRLAVGPCSTIAALRLVNDPFPYSSLAVAGYYAPGDGGGGSFTWQTGSFTDDGGLFIIPGGTPDSTGSAAWVRSLPGGLADVRWWGAVANGSRDCTAAIQAALWSGIYHIVIPNVGANYMYSRSMIIPSNTWLDIDPAAVIQQIAGTNQIAFRNANILYTSASDQNIAFTGGIVDGNTAGNTGNNTYFDSYMSFLSDPPTNTGTGSTALGANAPVAGVRGLLSFIGVTNLRVENTTILNALQHSLEIEACVNPYTNNITMNCPMADGIHTGGNARARHYDTFGTAGDDGVTVVCCDWYFSAPWSAPGRHLYGWGYGAPAGATQLNATASDFIIDNTDIISGSCIIKLSPGGMSGQSTTANLQNGIVRNVHGTGKYAVVGAATVPAAEGTATTFTGGAITGVTIKDVFAAFTAFDSAWGMIQLGDPDYVSSPPITFNDFTVDGVWLGASSCAGYLIKENNGNGTANTVGNINIRNITIDSAQANTDLIQFSAGFNSLTVQSLNVVGNSAWNTGSGVSIIKLLAGATWNKASLSDITAKNYGALFCDNGSTSGGNVTATDLHLFDLAIGFNVGNGSNTITTNIEISASDVGNDTGSTQLVAVGGNTAATTRAAVSSVSTAGTPGGYNGGWFYSYGGKLSVTGECVTVDGNGLTPLLGDRINSVTSNTTTGLVVGLNVCTNATGPVWAATGVADLPLTGGTLSGPLTGTTFIGALTGAASLNLLQSENLADIANPYTAFGSSLLQGNNATPVTSGTATPGLSARTNTIATLTANITMAAPSGGSGSSYDGEQLVIRTLQDGTGGRVVTWNSIYVLSASLPAPSTLANAMMEYDFLYDATNSKWRCNKIQEIDAGGSFPYLPLTGGTLSGPLTGTTFIGALSGTATNATTAATATGYLLGTNNLSDLNSNQTAQKNLQGSAALTITSGTATLVLSAAYQTLALNSTGGSVTIAKPSGTPFAGQKIHLECTQGAMGSTMSFGSGILYSTARTALSGMTTATYVYDFLLNYNPGTTAWEVLSAIQSYP
jgi:hypothetical protein